MQFDTVFDASHQGLSTYSFAAFGLIFVGLGALLVFRPALMNTIMPGGLQGRSRTVFGYMFLAFAVMWIVLVSATTFSKQQKIAKELSSNQVNIVEGRVDEYKPMPYTGHGYESFRVGDAEFSYSDYIGTGGFNHTASHGGPIRSGELVRIAYRNGEILRLEIARDQPK